MPVIVLVKCSIFGTDIRELLVLSSHSQANGKRYNNEKEDTTTTHCYVIKVQHVDGMDTCTLLENVSCLSIITKVVNPLHALLFPTIV